jgi:hypothetical protein
MPKLTRQINNSFRNYKHPFDFVIKTVTELRKLKSIYNLSSKEIDNAFIIIRNDKNKLGLILKSGNNIAKLCQVNNLYVNYVDDYDSLNNFWIRFEK